MKKKNVFIVFALMLLLVVLLTSCFDTTSSGSYSDVSKTKQVANILQANQPTPTDLDYSLERYNLIRRTYWVNGKREEAVSLACEIEKPMGYIVLFIGNTTVGSFTVDGKVSSLNSFLTPDSEYYTYGSSVNCWLADVDGSYGENDSGIFFFTVDGKYIEWSGDYLYSDIPMSIDSPVVKYEIGE